MSELLHGYRVLSPERWRAPLAIDVETGARVILADHRPRASFGWRAALHGAARRLVARRDARFAAPVSLEPLILVAPTHWNDDAIPQESAFPRITVAEAVNAGVEMVELTAMAHEAGAGASTHAVELTRDASGALQLRVIAPLETAPDDTDARAALFGLQLLASLIGAPHPVTGLRSVGVTTEAASRALHDALFRALPQHDWSTGESHTLFPSSVRKRLEAFVAFGAEAARVEAALAAIERAERAPKLPRLDLDTAIPMGESELVLRAADRWALQRTRFELAAMLHHRACVTIEGGDWDAAFADIERAVAIDAHPEYLTTLALCLDRRGDISGARALHDRAVTAIADLAPPPKPPLEIPDDYVPPPPREADSDFRSSWSRRAARTLEARGAFRTAHGDRDGALADLRASLAMHATDSAQRRITKLGG